MAISNHTGDDKLQFGTRNLVVRYNGIMTPSWLVNGSFTWGHNNLSDTALQPDTYLVQDLTQRFPCNIASAITPPCSDPNNIIRGNEFSQGLGYYENTQGDNYGFNLDTSKTFRFLGEHNVGIGYSFARNHYNGTKARTGPRYNAPTTDEAGATTDAVYGLDSTQPDQAALESDLLNNPVDGQFQLRLRGNGASAAGCTGGAEAATMVIPGLDGCLDGTTAVVLRQVRGEFGNPVFKTQSDYHTLFAQDSWSINKYVTVTAGLRWEQQKVAGVNAAYTFTDNWSPRVGISRGSLGQS